MPLQVKCCLFIFEDRKIEKKTLRGFQDAKRLFDRKHFFDLFEGETVIEIFPKSWKRSFDGSVEIPSKVRSSKVCVKSETKNIFST